MKKILLWLCALSVATPLKPQSIEPYFSFGYGTFQMDDMKRLQTDLLAQVPLPLKITDNFPAYYNCEAGILFGFSHNLSKVGVAVGEMATGSRAAISDYSGSYVIDNVVNGFKVGLVIEQNIAKAKHVELAFNGNVSILRTKYQLRNNYALWGQTGVEKYDFNAQGACMEPRFKLSYHLRRLSFTAQPGYFIDLTTSLYPKGNKKAELQVDGDPIKADFSGFRFNVVLSVVLGKCRF